MSTTPSPWTSPIPSTRSSLQLLRHTQDHHKSRSSSNRKNRQLVAAPPRPLGTRRQLSTSLGRPASSLLSTTASPSLQAAALASDSSSTWSASSLPWRSRSSFPCRRVAKVSAPILVDARKTWSMYSCKALRLRYQQEEIRVLFGFNGASIEACQNAKVIRVGQCNND